MVEVGLGGRLDATNVITPVAAAITSIDFDHEALLGHTLTAIAREKAGVIKPGIPVVIGPLATEAELAIAEVCRERGATLVRAYDRATVSSADAITADVATPDLRLTAVPLALRGRHQLDNAAVAVCVLEELQRQGVPLTASHIRVGLEQARWPGRLEAVSWRGADVLLDAAHNAAGSRALAAYLRARGWTATVLVIGVMARQGRRARLSRRSRRWQGRSSAPRRRRRGPCRPTNSPRLSGPQLDRSRIVRTVADPAAALDDACRAGARVVVAGSIFLIGALRGILR